MVKIKKISNDNIVQGLNIMLAQEYACGIRYATHAAALEGPYAESVSARLNEISDDEFKHAAMLRDRILALDGKPTMKLNENDLVYETKLEPILKYNIDEERSAIQDYSAILEKIPPTNAILYQALQEIIKDEQEHLEELTALAEKESTKH